MEKLNPIEAFVAWLGTSMWVFYSALVGLGLMVVRWVTGVNSMKEIVIQHSAQLAEFRSREEKHSKEGDARFNKVEKDLSHLTGLAEGMAKSLDQLVDRLNSK